HTGPRRQRVGLLEDHEVAAIERSGANPDHDLGRAGLRDRFLVERDPGDVAEFVQAIDVHDILLALSRPIYILCRPIVIATSSRLEGIMTTDTRTRMLEATARLLQLRGYHGTGLNEILAESGAPRGSLYF